MSDAKTQPKEKGIHNGILKRRIPKSFANKSIYRTDISKAYLTSDLLKTVIYILPDGRHLQVSSDDLRSALKGVRTRSGGTKVGPYNINFANRTINGVPVHMEIGEASAPTPDVAPADAPPPSLSAWIQSNQTKKEKFSLVRQRIGQPEFRKKLLVAYDNRCAITECQCAAVLEAAHIIPYEHAQNNDVTNGIILRADLHKLFDSGLLIIHTDYSIEIDPRAQDDYGDLHGQKIYPPKKKAHRPSVDALQFRLSHIAFSTEPDQP